nr:unnamed protein product [Callosobruchus chinensis]
MQSREGQFDSTVTRP